MLYDHLKFKNSETGEEQVYQLAVSQYGENSPSSTTPGKPGVLYLNTFNGNLYKCTAADPANNHYTWVAMVGAGGLFATAVNGEGAEEISVMTLRISKPNAGYVLSIGDKLITADNYLYEITALPESAMGGYTAKLICKFGDSSGAGIHVGPEAPGDTNLLWVDTGDETEEENPCYTKAEIDAMLGSYVNDIAALVGGDA